MIKSILYKIPVLVILTLACNKCEVYNEGFIDGSSYSPAREWIETDFIMDADGNVIMSYPVTRYEKEKYYINVLNTSCSPLKRETILVPENIYYQWKDSIGVYFRG